MWLSSKQCKNRETHFPEWAVTQRLQRGFLFQFPGNREKPRKENAKGSIAQVGICHSTCNAVRMLFIPLDFLNHSFRIRVLKGQSQIERGPNRRRQRYQDAEQENAGLGKHLLGWRSNNGGIVVSVYKQLFSLRNVVLARRAAKTWENVMSLYSKRITYCSTNNLCKTCCFLAGFSLIRFSSPLNGKKWKKQKKKRSVWETVCLYSSENLSLSLYSFFPPSLWCISKSHELKDHVFGVF